MREIYSMFNGELCAGKGQLVGSTSERGTGRHLTNPVEQCSYKGQFIVSWKQILSNPKSKYQHLLNVLEVCLLRPHEYR